MRIGAGELRLQDLDTWTPRRACVRATRLAWVYIFGARDVSLLSILVLADEVLEGRARGGPPCDT